MPFKFKWLCELFEELQNNRHQHATTAAKSQNPDYRTILSWFNKYDHKIERNGRSAVAFLSSIFPERRVDRVYNLQEKRLAPLFGRALGLGSSRAADLNRWRERDGEDFSICVKRVMCQCEFDLPLAGREVTLDEIDGALHQIAANSPFSSPAVKSAADDRSAEDLLRPVLQRLQSSEAKWLVRLIFKSFGSLQIPEYFTMKQFHFLLPDLLTMQNSLAAAVKVLAKSTIRVLPPRPNKQYEQALRPLVAREITPELGIMVRRQPYHKARSIKHCCNIVNKRRMSVERKYDGEYCQIHIDMSKGKDCIRIFSKSGKDSTNDRLRLHGAIKDSLRLDMDGCRIRDRCIIEGELLVWSSTKKEILRFHKIRKHVRHGGRYVGTAQDSPVSHDEELMIVYYDLLILDGKLLLNESHTTRRQHLKALVRNIEGSSIIGERRIIDFNSSRASQRLRAAFAHSITHRWEGLVLKSCDEPFFSFQSSNHGIKLKKDYITGMGDSADLCLVGGRRDARGESEIGLGPLRWTSFHVGCLTNKEEVLRYSAKPRIKIIDELTTHSMPDSELMDLNRLGRLLETPFSTSIQEYDVEIDFKVLTSPSELFKQPFVAEIMGAGFERLSNSSFYTLRFPRKIDRKIKIHTDRNLTDTVSFVELQSLAEESLNMSESPDSQEDANWIGKLIKADGKDRNTQDTSQGSGSTRTPRSAVTMSISPVERRKESVPLLYVRADTEDRETPERESFGSTSASQNSSLPRSNSDQRVKARQTVDIQIASTLLSPLYSQPNASSLPLNSTHTSHKDSRDRGSKRTRQHYEPVVPNQKENKRNCPNILGAEKLPNHQQIIQTSLIIDPTASVDARIERTPLFTMDNLLSASATRIEINLVSPLDVQPPAYPVYNSLQATIGSASHSATKQPAQLVTRGSSSIQMSQNHSSANIGRRRTTRRVSHSGDQIVAGKMTTDGHESQSLANPASSVDEATGVETLVGARVVLQIPQEILLRPTNSAETSHSKQIEESAIATHATGFPLSGEPSKDQIFKLAEPIFITDSLYNLKTKSQKGLTSMLRELRTNVTFSVDHFLDHIDNSTASTTPAQRSLHVMLINFRDIEGAKKDVEEIFEHLTFRAKRSPPQGSKETKIELEHRLLQSYSNTILVFDYKVFCRCEAGELSIDVLKLLRDTEDGMSMFGGIIKLDKRRLRLGRGARFLLLTDWSWAG